MFKMNFGYPSSNCRGMSRRHALRLGTCGLIGGMTLPRLLELQAKAAGPSGAKAKSCIFLFLEGGPPHQDMWDPKPDAPAEIRGPFQAIRTNVPGTFVTDQLPLCAKIADKYTILRNHGHNDNGHSTGYHYVMTGRRASFPDGDNPIPNNEFYPSIGSAVSRTLGAQGSLPPYINLPHPMQGGGPGFYGAEHAPFVIEADPSQPDFDVKDLQPPIELSASRLGVRQRLLAGLDALERQQQQPTGRAMSTYYDKAYQLIASAEARRAFNIHAEPDSVRDAYGRTQLGQCALLARRLVEASCRFVGVDAPGWDVHFNCFPSLKTDLIPYADQAFSALVTDLDQRGLLDETLVIMMGEMGRTPRINAQAGRDHWSMAQTIVFAGGGTIPGQVIGATDKHASATIGAPVGVNDLIENDISVNGHRSRSNLPQPIGTPRSNRRRRTGYPRIDLMAAQSNTQSVKALSRRALAPVPPSRRALAPVLEALIVRPTHHYQMDSRIPTSPKCESSPSRRALEPETRGSYCISTSLLPSFPLRSQSLGSSYQEVLKRRGKEEKRKTRRVLAKVFGTDLMLLAIAAVPPSRRALAAVLGALFVRPTHHYQTDARFTRMPFVRLPFGQQSEPGLAPIGLGYVTIVAAIIVLFMLSLSAHAQLPPSIGYMFPSGGPAGQTIDVTLGGYDWTPDMQLFVRDERMRLAIVGVPGPVLVPQPPYWFGKKARRAPYKLARETKARLTIPADVPPGVYKWQAANANGATACGRFSVTAAPIQLESTETANVVKSLPVCLCGQIKLISEIDYFQFIAPTDGLVKCTLTAASIASPLRATVEVRDATGRLVANAADTAGGDLTLFFRARAGQRYTAAVYDLDFCGDSSFVYQLNLATETTDAQTSVSTKPEVASTLSLPAMVSGVFNQKNGADRYHLSGQVGDIWTILVSGEKTGSQVDPVVTVFNASGKELARGDDSVGSTDAQLEFKLPVAGEYDIVVSDLSGTGGSPLATYELSVQRSVPDFQLQTVEMLAVPIGGKATIELKATRRGGFTDAIDVQFVGLPPGMSVAGNLKVPAKQNSLKVEVQVDATSAATAAMVSVQGQAVINEQTIERTSDPILMCATIKPPFEIDAEGKDDVTKWPRGTTYPAPVLIARDPGFKGDIVLEMTSLQGRHVQGIAGPELRVGPNESRVLYPVFLPEWLETTRTSRMVVNGVAQVADPQGNLRYSLSRQKTRMGFLPTGALLKISAEPEIAYQPQKPLVIPVMVHRDVALNQSLRLTLVSDGLESSPFSAAEQDYAQDVSRCEFAIDVNKALISNKEYPLTLRATVMKDGKYPVVSETKVIVSLSLHERSNFLSDRSDKK